MAQQNERDIVRPITIMLDGPTIMHGLKILLSFSGVINCADM